MKRFEISWPAPPQSKHSFEQMENRKLRSRCSETKYEIKLVKRGKSMETVVTNLIAEPVASVQQLLNLHSKVLQTK